MDRLKSVTLTLLQFVGIGRPAPARSVLVDSNTSNQTAPFHATTGAYVGNFATGGVHWIPSRITLGPGGDVFVANATNHDVERYNGTTGASVAPGSGGLISPGDVQFGPTGSLYVSDYIGAQVLRYNGTTGTFAGGAGWIRRRFISRRGSSAGGPAEK